MKITRVKKSSKILSFFVAHFNYREPYQVLIDATFCQAALKNKVGVQEQLNKFFSSPAKLVTTQCIILESESLGAPLTGATMIVKQFYVHKCGHEGKPISAAECIMSMTKDSRYIVASQDRTLQERLRRVPGRCLMYLHRATPVLEEPSKASKKYVAKRAENLLPNAVEERIGQLKKAQGLDAPTTDVDHNQRKRKGPKNPNPLSCKKSKKQRPQQQSTKHVTEQNHSGPATTAGISDKSKTPLKAKRKRIKLPTHVREALAATNSKQS